MGKTQGPTLKPDGSIPIPKPAWCIIHGDFAWLFPDSGVSCFTAAVVEISTTGCMVRELAPLKWAKP